MSTHSQSLFTRTYLLPSLSSILLMLVGCHNSGSITEHPDSKDVVVDDAVKDADNNDISTSAQSSDSQVIATVPTYPEMIKAPSMPTMMTPTRPPTEDLGNVNAVEGSYARLAARHRNVCPKLIDVSVKAYAATREQEFFTDKSCEYYVYLVEGQSVMASVNSTKDMFKVQLVVPENHDFANGAYRTVQDGKHVITVEYKEHHGDRPQQQYDFKFQIVSDD